MQKIRTVVIGFAHMHVNEIVEYLMGQPSFEVVGIADVPAPTPEKTEARYTRAWNLQNNSEKLGLKPYDCYVNMLDELKPDMAFILCENYRKLEVVRECAKRHVNVSIEKPMSVSYKDAAEIAAVAKENGIEAMVNWPVIWRPYVHRQLAALESGIVHKVMAYVSPMLLGGAGALSPIGGQGFPHPDKAIRLKDPILTRIGEDYLFESEVAY